MTKGGRPFILLWVRKRFRGDYFGKLWKHHSSC